LQHGPLKTGQIPRGYGLKKAHVLRRGGAQKKRVSRGDPSVDGGNPFAKMKIPGRTRG